MKLNATILIFVFSLLNLTFASEEFRENKIVGGAIARLEDFPYQASIFVKTFFGLYYSFICGGSILSEKYILTAGHCVKTDKSLLFVKVGISTTLDIFSKKFSVENVILHEGYVERNNIPYNDIALLKLRDGLQFGKFVQRIALPQPEEKFAGDAIVSGFGKFSSFVPLPTPWLKYAELTIIPIGDCEKELKAEIRDTNLCAKRLEGSFANTCNGDSGGPLVQNGKVIGVVSFGSIICELKTPAVFARVSSYVRWIQFKMITN